MEAQSTNAEKNVQGKRLQIRGFPKIWAEKLSLDEIGWNLFDLLVGYGAIDNISVTQSNKNSQLYGIVDMMRKKDVNRVFSELLDENGHLYLEEWKSTLQFKILDDSNKQHFPKSKNPSASGVKPMPLREVITNLSSVSSFLGKVGSDFGLKVKEEENKKNVDETAAEASSIMASSSTYTSVFEGPIHCYKSEELLELKKYATPNFNVAPEFLEAFNMCKRDNTGHYKLGDTVRRPKKVVGYGQQQKGRFMEKN